MGDLCMCHLNSSWAMSRNTFVSNSHTIADAIHHPVHHPYLCAISFYTTSIAFQMRSFLTGILGSQPMAHFAICLDLQNGLKLVASDSYPIPVSQPASLESLLPGYASRPQPSPAKPKQQAHVSHLPPAAAHNTTAPAVPSTAALSAPSIAAPSGPPCRPRLPSMSVLDELMAEFEEAQQGAQVGPTLAAGPAGKALQEGGQRVQKRGRPSSLPPNEAKLPDEGEPALPVPKRKSGRGNDVEEAQRRSEAALCALPLPPALEGLCQTFSVCAQVSAWSRGVA